MEQINEIRQELKKVQTKMDDIHSALIGNPITKDGGLVYRVIEGEVQIQRLNDKIDEVEKKQNERMLDLEKDKAKQGIYIGIIWACAGGILSTIVIAIINHIFK